MGATPLRTCVGCREHDARDALTRLVSSEERLVVDRSRCAPGRGAWVHARAACLDAFARKGGFVRALRCVIPKAERARLRAQLSEVQG